MARLIEYDISNVPFPLERDPDVDGIKPKKGRRRQRKPRATEYERYRLYTEDELGDFPPVRWYIKGYFAIGELTCLYGKGGTYKSFVALDWSCHLALNGVPVVYIVSEGASGIKARIAAWKKRHGIEELPELYLMPSSVNLHQHGAVDTFIAAMEAQLGSQRPGLIVVDTLARNFVGGNENLPQDMGLFVDGIEAIRRQFKTAIIVIHHTTKDGETERGTEALRNGSFAMFKLTLQNQHLRVKVACDRMKEAEPPPDVTLRLTRVELPEMSENPDDPITSLVAGWPYSGLDSGLSDTPGDPNHSGLSGRQLRLLKALKDSNGGPSRHYLSKKLGVSVTTVKRDIKALRMAGFIVAEGHTRGLELTLTAAGEKALE